MPAHYLRKRTSNGLGIEVVEIVSIGQRAGKQNLFIQSGRIGAIHRRSIVVLNAALGHSKSLPNSRFNVLTFNSITFVAQSLSSRIERKQVCIVRIAL